MNINLSVCNRAATAGYRCIHSKLIGGGGCSSAVRCSSLILGDLPPLAVLRDLDTISTELERRQPAEPAPGTTPDLFEAAPVPEASG